MTLTDIMPTLRMSIPDPIDLFAWPPGTVTTTDDVVIERLSMLGVSTLLDTPCEWSTTESSRSGCRTVMICTVSAVVHDGDEPIALVDGDLHTTGALWSHARLIGRISVAYRGMFRLLTDGTRPGGAVQPRSTTLSATTPTSVSLPRDLAVGDLLIVPCLPVSNDLPATLAAATPTAATQI